MKTKLFTLLLAVAVSIGTMHAAIVNGTCGANLTWSLNTKDSTLTIEGSGKMTSAPWSDYTNYIAYVNLPDGLISICDYAFSGCSALTIVTLPNSLATIGERSFSGCTSLNSIVIPNSVTAIGEHVYEYCSNAISVSISSNLTTISDGAFWECTSLSSVIIPNGVTTIVAAAFEGCSSLMSVTIPSTVTSVGHHVFYGTNVKEFNYSGSIEEWCSKQWPSGNWWEGGDFWGTWGLSGSFLIYLNDNLVTNLTIPETVANIGNAFSRCNSLQSVIFGNNVTNIGERAFSQCSNLSYVLIPNSVISIGNNAFSGCSSLTSLTIPSSVTNIGSDAFSGCNLSSVTCEAATPPTISDNTFPNKSVLLFVPEGSIEAYQNALYWEEFTNIRAIGSAPLVQFLDWDGTILSSANVTIGTAATTPADPTRTGYTFIGWDKDFSNITEDLVVTAQYKINRYEVIFKDWDETILKTDSVYYNTAATAPANPLREGHEFIGWDKDFSHVSSDMIINARYAVNYYPVGFLNYDGTLLSEQSIAYNQAAMEPNVPAREGYTFIGWTADIEHITARTFAIALYEKDGINVTYISEEGDTIVSERVDMHLPDAPVVSGKTFTGWLTESASNAEGIVFRATYTLDNPTTGEDVVVIPTSSTADVSFPYITGAMTYMLVIRDLFGTVVCKIMFDADGHLLGIAFAPGRNRTQKAQSEGFHFTVEGLTPGTTYEYEFVAYDEADQVIETLTGSFETTADETGVINISSASAPQKVINDGHVFVLRGDKTYTMQGQEVK